MMDTIATSGERLQRRQRRCGLLLHPTSLPGDLAQGDLGHEAFRFIEFCAASGVHLWQMLPLGPTHEDGSPYQCLSVHAGNPLLISLDWLVDRGWLDKSRCPDDTEQHEAYRQHCLQMAWVGFEVAADPDQQQAYEAFQAEHAHWLSDFALYIALRWERGHRPWWEWPAGERDRKPAALKKARQRLANEIAQVQFEQFVFFSQWRELKEYAHQHGLALFGDVPIFVAHDSAEVWAHPEYFSVDALGRAETVAGVPPDYFSETGQLWGNPLYRWDRLQADGFQWWIERLRTQLELFDLLRIDHFRGFEACWEIPATAETAIEGHWVKAPGEALLRALHEAFHQLPLVAEDLGTITPEVVALRQAFSLPGMKILQFAFDGNADNPYLPHNHERHSVVYTGTHDNDTTLSWYKNLNNADQQRVADYLGYAIAKDMPWPLIRSAIASVAELAVLPMQDVLGLGEGNRMNLPGTVEGNWRWRFQWSQLPAELAPRLRHMNRLYGRSDD